MFRRECIPWRNREGYRLFVGGGFGLGVLLYCQYTVDGQRYAASVSESFTLSCRMLRGPC